VTFNRFLKTLNARGMFRIRPGLGRVRRVLRALGNPHHQWPAIHIAGTNGKGSVAAALESVLRACGYRTGLYTSPHLLDLRERIRVDGLPLGPDFTAAAEAVLRGEKRARAPLTYFEFLTAMAFWSFSQRQVDIGIVECGLGGLWDATNVLESPLASIITSVGLDHTGWLGPRERDIAVQKAGIIKKGGYVVSGVRGPGRSEICAAARAKKAAIVELGRDFRGQPLVTSWRSGKQTLRFSSRGETAESITLGLLGAHQVDNAALAMAALRRLTFAVPPCGRRAFLCRAWAWSFSSQPCGNT